MGFRLDDPKEKFLWWMHKAFEKGISPREFRNSYVKDLDAVMKIDQITGEKRRIEDELNG